MEEEGSMKSLGKFFAGEHAPICVIKNCRSKTSIIVDGMPICERHFRILFLEREEIVVISDDKKFIDVLVEYQEKKAAEKNITVILEAGALKQDAADIFSAIEKVKKLVPLDPDILQPLEMFQSILMGEYEDMKKQAVESQEDKSYA